MGNESHHRIKLWMGWCLILAAFTIDILEMLFDWALIGWVLNPVMAVAVTFLFWIVFQMLGVSYTANTKRFAVMTIQSLGEMLPGLDTLPILSFLWTFGMILTVVMVRMEDRGEKPSVLGAMSEVQAYSDTISGSPVGAFAIKAQRKLRERNERWRNT